MTRFIQHLKREQAEDIRILNGTTLVGRHPSSSIWVLNQPMHITAKGGKVAHEGSTHTWTPTCIIANCDKVGLNELILTVATKLSTAPLGELVTMLESACKHNFIKALLLLGDAVMSCHYTKIAHLFGGFPIVLAISPTSIKAGLSYSGWLRIPSMWKAPMRILWKEALSPAFRTA